MMQEFCNPQLGYIKLSSSEFSASGSYLGVSGPWVTYSRSMRGSFIVKN